MDFIEFKKLKVGYIRVSSSDQNPARQLDGIELDKVYKEFVSGVNMNRPELKSCLEFLREGDEFFVHSIDRLARNSKDLLTIVESLNERDVYVTFVTENLKFTGKDDPIGKLMLSMLSAFHQFDLSMIRMRQREGIAKAKERGQHIGRKPLKASIKNKIVELRDSGCGAVEIASKLKIGTSTVYKYW